MGKKRQLREFQISSSGVLAIGTYWGRNGEEAIDAYCYKVGISELGNFSELRSRLRAVSVAETLPSHSPRTSFKLPPYCCQNCGYSDPARPLPDRCPNCEEVYSSADVPA